MSSPSPYPSSVIGSRAGSARISRLGTPSDGDVLRAAVDAARKDMQIRRSATAARSEYTLWTTRTAATDTQLVSTEGVSTVAYQRRLRRKEQREFHAEAQLQREEEEVNVLRVLISGRKKSLAEARARIVRLREHNGQLVARIQSVEGDAMDRVHGHLVRYGKYTRSRTTLKDRFTMVHGDKREETDSAIADGQALVDKRQAEAEGLDQRIEEATRELRNLVLYRESGQYELRRTIFRLRDALSKLRQRQATETKNVTRETDHLRDSLMVSWRDMAQEVRDSASHSVLQALAPPVRAKALENMSARQELAIHRAEHNQLKQRIAALEEEQRQIQRDIAALERHGSGRPDASRLTSRAPAWLVRELPHVSAGIRELALMRDTAGHAGDDAEPSVAAASVLRAAARSSSNGAASGAAELSSSPSPRGSSPAHGLSPTRYRVRFAQDKDEVSAEPREGLSRPPLSPRPPLAPRRERNRLEGATAAAHATSGHRTPSSSPARGALAGTRAALASPALAADPSMSEAGAGARDAQPDVSRYVPVAMALGVGPTAKRLEREARREGGGDGEDYAVSAFRRQARGLPGLGEASQRTRTFMQQLQG